MGKVAAESQGWAAHEWLIRPMGNLALSGTVHRIEPRKKELFTFDVPLQVVPY